MQRLEVGGYLKGYPSPVQEKCTLTYDGGGPTLLVSLRAISAKEAKKVQKGKIDFAVFEKEEILFLLANIPGAIDWSDAPFHIGLYADDRPIPEDIPDGQGWGLMVLGLNSNNGMIKALRLVGLGTEISREMIRIIQIQQKAKISQVDCHNKINKVYREYDCEQMVRKANAIYKVGGCE